MRKPTETASPPALDAPEHERARWWRENVVRLSRPELAKRIGMSPSRILDYEAGHRRDTGKAIEPEQMRRYRMLCAAVTMGLQFDWLECRLEPAGRVKVIVGS